jgi:hypothetical protein
MIPASCAGLDAQAAYQALLKSQGNISAAARLLGLPVSDFRIYSRANPHVRAAALEAEEEALDEAEATLRAALKSEDMGRALAAAAHILRTNPAAWRRGWHSSAHYAPTGKEPGRPTKIKWRDN